MSLERFHCPTCEFHSNVLEDLVAHVGENGHGRTFENGNKMIATFHHELLGNRKNEQWEVWDFVDRKLLAEFGTERECVDLVGRLYAEKFDRVRYLVHAPHNVLLFPGPRASA
jgi:hypothetical protein